MTAHLPLIFAISPHSNADPVDLFQARLLQDSPDAFSPPVYLVTPYNLPRSSDIPAYWTPYRLEAPSHEIMLVTDSPAAYRPSRRRHATDSLWDAPPPMSTYIHGHPGRHVFFHGTWYPTDRALLSVYCAAPIPVINFIGTQRAPWPVEDNYHPPLYVTPGTPEISRAWARRWSPDRWDSDVTREYSTATTTTITTHSRRLTGGGVARPTLIREPSPPPPSVTRASVAETIPTPTPTPTPPTPIRLPECRSVGRATLPSFVLEALVRDAISRHTTCPITLEPLTASAEIAVTDCYHIFDATALATWRASGEDKCPSCRTRL